MQKLANELVDAVMSTTDKKKLKQCLDILHEENVENADQEIAADSGKSLAIERRIKTGELVECEIAHNEGVSNNDHGNIEGKNNKKRESKILHTMNVKKAKRSRTNSLIGVMKDGIYCLMVLSLIR